MVSFCSAQAPQEVTCLSEGAYTETKQKHRHSAQSDHDLPASSGTKFISTPTAVTMAISSFPSIPIIQRVHTAVRYTTARGLGFGV